MSNKQENKSEPNNSVLRCINIDCVFNSSNRKNATRNICQHPNVSVESSFADITLAICSEFRSRKDYILKSSHELTELKSGETIIISGSPEITAEPVKKITTKELEDNKSSSDIKQEPEINLNISPESEKTRPAVIKLEETDSSIQYNLTDKPGSDFLILKKLYQPYTKKGLAGSVIVHLLVIFLMWQFLVTEEKKNEGENHQRIVVVEDLEMPKFEPPDVDKIKEEENTDESEVKDNTKIVRPKINQRTVKPRIVRPKTTEEKDTTLTAGDTSRPKFDSTLIANTRDTSRIFVPDSLRMNFSENDVGLKLWFPKGWSLIDNRQVALNQQNFNGVIISTDSLSENPGAVNMFVLIDDPNHSSFNKATYKNLFQMDDTTVIAYVTDPAKSSGKKMNVKYYLFTDPKGLKNIQVNVDFSSQEMMEKYRQLVDAVVRSIKIAEPPVKSDNP
ncbi:MAG: hypothetical protein N2510_09255 [Ignavibacteria bacterium]|nr:hypothetical protein [Ignavibacteria bacterium]